MHPQLGTRTHENINRFRAYQKHDTLRATMIIPAVSHRCFMTFTGQAWNNDVSTAT